MSQLILGDAKRILQLIPDGAYDSSVSSPPYYRQRDYGVAGQIGQERTLDEYLERLWDVFDEVKRALVTTGTCFVNLGDTYRGKCRQMSPERFAIGMVDRGWILRNAIIWHKPNCKPESVKSRFTNDWEAIFFFVKNCYYFARQFEPCCEDTLKRCEQFVRRGKIRPVT